MAIDRNNDLVQVVTINKRIPDLNTTPATTSRRSLKVPVFNPATNKTEQTPLDTPAGTVVSNDVRGAEKFVDFTDSRYFGVPANATTLDRLDPETLVVGNWATVDNPSESPTQIRTEAKRYRAARVAAGTTGAILAYINAGNTTTEKAPVVWALEGSAAAQAATIEPFNPNANEYRKGAAVKLEIEGVLLLFDAAQNLVKSMFPDNKIPAPIKGGNQFWKVYNPNPFQHRQNTDQGTTLPAFTIQLNSQNQEQGEQRTLLGFGKAQGARIAAIAYRWQNENGTPANVFEVCLNYRDPSEPVSISDLNPAPNVWKKLLLEGDTVPGGGTGVTGEEYTDATYDPIDGLLQLISPNGATNLTILSGMQRAYAADAQGTRYNGNDLGAAMANAGTYGTAGTAEMHSDFLVNSTLTLRYYARLLGFGYFIRFGVDGVMNLARGTVVENVNVVGGTVALYGTAEHRISGGSFSNTKFRGAGGQVCDLVKVTLSCTDGFVLFGDGGTYNLYDSPLPAGAVVEAGTTVNIYTTATGGPGLPTLDVYAVPQAVRSAVTAGSYTSGELQGQQPAGSVAGMKFTTAASVYEYMPGASGVLVWNRFSKV